MKKEQILTEVEQVWDNPNYDDLLDLVDKMVKFIKEK